MSASEKSSLFAGKRKKLIQEAAKSTNVLERNITWAGVALFCIVASWVPIDSDQFRLSLICGLAILAGWIYRESKRIDRRINALCKLLDVEKLSDPAKDNPNDQ